MFCDVFHSKHNNKKLPKFLEMLAIFSLGAQPLCNSFDGDNSPKWAGSGQTAINERGFDSLESDFCCFGGVQAASAVLGWVGGLRKT